LEKIPQYILSLDNIPKIRKFKVTENIDMGGAYMCYSERASSQMKEWNNPEELKKVIKYIQSLGIKVVNIDVKPYCKNIEGVIYLNGTNYSLQDRVNIMSNSLFYMGMASGLSWLAWACHKPAVIISGFSLPIAEYDNPYRVFNTDACFGCWNYTTNYACTSFSCNKAITHKQVIKTINKLLNI
jgi:autotransporter strand-loop-strand O-heptosyltransferase